MGEESAAAIVRQMRLGRRMTKAMFSRLVEVPLSTISRIESGTMDPTWSMLQRILRRAGYSFNGELRDVGDDAVIVRTVEKLRATQKPVTAVAVSDLPQTAVAARVAKRAGARMFALTMPLDELMRQLNLRGQKPIASSLEAFAGSVAELRSFTPVIYVDDPNSLGNLLQPRSPGTQTVVAVLPTTANVAANTVVSDDGTRMVRRDWALVDALASPGRQPEIARTLLPDLVLSA